MSIEFHLSTSEPKAEIHAAGQRLSVAGAPKAITRLARWCRARVSNNLPFDHTLLFEIMQRESVRPVDWPQIRTTDSSFCVSRPGARHGRCLWVQELDVQKFSTKAQIKGPGKRVKACDWFEVFWVVTDRTETQVLKDDGEFHSRQYKGHVGP
jgi:hypothetical protein